MRPATPLICAFINAHREEFGVVPICRALAVHGVQIAPRTYWAHRLAAPSKRALWDTTITEILAGIYEPDPDGKRPPECLYGSLKMWAYLQRQGIPVARCTVEKIMRAHGWRGATRARRPPRTTESDPAANRAPDLVGRRWRVAAPNLLVVADFTYVPMVVGFGYTAFVVDAYAGLIPGWECSLTKDTGFVERALRHAAAFGSRQGHPFEDAIHHSDAGSQTGFNRWKQHPEIERVFDGTFRWVDADDVGPAGNALAGSAAGSTRYSARVLAKDCRGVEHCRRGGGLRCVGAGRQPAVPTGWRHAVCGVGTRIGTLLVVC